MVVWSRTFGEELLFKPKIFPKNPTKIDGKPDNMVLCKKNLREISAYKPNLYSEKVFILGDMNFSFFFFYNFSSQKVLFITQFIPYVQKFLQKWDFEYLFESPTYKTKAQSNSPRFDERKLRPMVFARSAPIMCGEQAKLHRTVQIGKQNTRGSL